jgi:kanamycin kinase
VIAQAPREPVEVPPAVSSLAGGKPITPVWRNELGGLTFQLGSGPGARFVKWSPAGAGLDLRAEATRLAWAAAYTPVPRVLDVAPDGSWLLTEALHGQSAVAPRWVAEPRVAVTAIGAGLRALHESLPVSDCPFRWVPEQGSVADAPQPERLVVCHGDACAPNTLIGPDGHWSGHVDLGQLGVGDPWADLAIATWSTEWNYGPGWADTLLAAYGIEHDAERTAYYRRLWGAP